VTRPWRRRHLGTEADRATFRTLHSASLASPALREGLTRESRLTDVGAIAGLVAGGVGCGVAIGWTLASSTTVGWADVLMSQPAAWTVPLALATMVAVSLLTATRVPVHAGRFLVRLHTPEVVEVGRG